MRTDDCFQLGHISRLHGFKGEVIAVFDTDRPEAYETLESVFLEIRGELIPFFIEDLSRNSKGHFILKFEEIDSEEDARSLISKELWLPLQALPALDGKNFYFHEVIDFRLFHQEKEIGLCADILDSSAQPLFKVIDSENREILIPAIDEFILKIDRENKLIELELPDGLLELYQNNG